MIKKVIGSLALLCSMSTVAQQSTSSAYSYYGLGEIKFKGTVENRSMGGVSIFGDSIHVNLQNPASYAGLKRTTFTLGGSYNTTNFESNASTGKARRSAIDYMALGFPITKKMGVGFGILPFTTVGYQLHQLNPEPGQMNNINTGEGGINKAYLSLGYQLNKELSVGATLNYNFGTIETSSTQIISDTQFGTKEFNRSEMSGINFNFGAMWNKKITDKHTLFAAANYAPGSKINMINDRNLAIIEYSTNGSENIVDEQEITTPTRNLQLPSTMSLGAGYGENRKWLVGAEFTKIDNSNYGNRFADIKNSTFNNGSKLSVGGYYIPKYNSFNSYFERITYRAGFKHENTGLELTNPSLGMSKEIKDTSVTLGFTFPISGSFSRINIGVEHGKRGTKDANFLQEKYTNVSLSISFSDLWFVKRKYN